MFLSNLPPRIIVFYDKESRSYVAYYLDNLGNQVGACCYGATKKDALFNLQN